MLKWVQDAEELMSDRQVEKMCFNYLKTDYLVFELKINETDNLLIISTPGFKMSPGCKNPKVDTEPRCYESTGDSVCQIARVERSRLCIKKVVCNEPCAWRRATATPPSCRLLPPCGAAGCPVSPLACSEASSRWLVTSRLHTRAHTHTQNNTFNKTTLSHTVYD